MVFVYDAWSGGLADPVAMDVKSSSRTQSAVAANPDTLDGVCRGSNGGFPFLGSCCLCTHLPAFTRSARFRAPTVGTPGSCGKPGRRALCASTQWHAALSTRSHALPAGTPSRTRWHTARALFSPHCRLSRLSYARTVSRTWCLHQKPRRVSAVLYPLPQPAHQDRPPSPSLHEDHPPPCPSACHPLLWGDWPRCQPRRAWMQWLRRHLVTVNAPPVTSPPSTPSLLSRAERAHWRLNWLQRFTRNARRSPASPVEITIYGLSTEFAQELGLRVA